MPGVPGTPPAFRKCLREPWRTRSGAEFDFVVYGAGGIHAIDVKNSRWLRLRDLRGIRTCGQDYPETSLLLRDRGEETLERDGVRCMPMTLSVRTDPGEGPAALIV